MLLAGGSGRSVLIDLRLGAADQESLLDLKPQHNLADLCRNIRRLDRNMFEQSLARHASGDPFAGPTNAVDDVSAVTPQGVRQVLGFARTAFPYVVVDLDRVLRPEQLSAVVQLDLLLLPMHLDIASLHSARHLIEALNKAGFHESAYIVVASRYGQSKELPLRKVEQAIGLAIPYQVPDAPADMNIAGNKGVPVVLERPRARVSRSMQKLAAAVRDFQLHRQNGHGKVASLFGGEGLVGAGTGGGVPGTPGRQRGDP